MSETRESARNDLENPGSAPERLEFCQAELKAAQRIGDKVGIAKAETALGIAYRELRTGYPEENIPRAIARLQAALCFWTERDHPLEWATAQYHLGAAYQELPDGDPAENQMKAIACYEFALRIHKRRDHPVEWARIQNNLGGAYNVTPGNRADLRTAVGYYEAALRVRTERDYPRDWAWTQNNLGIAYSSHSTRDAAENFRTAIDYFEAALRVFTEQDFPGERADVLSNMAVAYSKFPGNRKDNLSRAIAANEPRLRDLSPSDAMRMPRSRRTGFPNSKLNSPILTNLYRFATMDSHGNICDRH